MGKFWGSSEGIAEGRDGIAIGESIGFDEIGGRKVVEQELVNEVWVISWLNGNRVKLAMMNEITPWLVDGGNIPSGEGAPLWEGLDCELRVHWTWERDAGIL
jgi:hypothetical protein